MFYPIRVFPNEILCRLPVIKTAQNILKGMTDSGIIVTSNNLNQAPSDMCRQFYRQMHTDKNGEVQAKAPVVVEVLMVAADDTEVISRDITTGRHYVVKNFNLVDWGIDENAEWWYFTMSPKDLRAEISQEDAEVIRLMEAAENVYMSEYADEISAQIKAGALRAGSTQPTSTIKAPLIKI